MADLYSAFGGTPSPTPQATPETPQPQARPKDLFGVFGHPDKIVDNTLGKALAYGEKHPWSAAMNVLQGPQRGVEQAIVGGLDPGKIGHAIMDPGEGQELEEGVRKKIGLQGFEDKYLPGEGLGAKLGKGFLNTLQAIGTDPATFVPVGRAAEALGTAVPAIGKAAGEFADFAKGTLPGKILDPESDLVNTTTNTKAVALSELKKTKNDTQARIAAAHPVINANQDAIRAGQMPRDVQNLFNDPKNIPQPKVGLRPEVVREAVGKDARQLERARYHAALANAGLMHDPTVYLAQNATHVFPDLAKVPQAQKGLKTYGARGGEENDVIAWMQAVKSLGNKAMLTVPFPHGLNLTDLTYQRYGLPTALAGLRNTYAIMSGRVSPDLAMKITELEQLGGKSEYANLYHEGGITRLANIPGTEGAAKTLNKGLVPAQRLANWSQHAFLNNLETGLRVAAMDAEKAKGITGVGAVRNVHKALGSDEANRLTESATKLATPFAQFHVQTSLGSGLRTLATNPGRITNVIHANEQFNNSVNPGNSPKYRMSIPSLKTERALSAPISYMETVGGPLAGLTKYYSSASMAQRGKLQEAASAAVGRFVPAGDVLDVIKNLVEDTRRQSGEAAADDIIPSLIGGYYTKKGN